MLKLVTPEKVNVSPAKSGENNGKPWKLWPIGINVKGEWYNGAVFDQESVDMIQEGKEIILDFFKEEYQGKMYWKFKLPSKNDMLEYRIKRLEDHVFNTPKEEPVEPDQTDYPPIITDGTEDSNLPF